MGAWILPEWKLKVCYVEDRVVSVNHEYFVFSIDQHHVPVVEGKSIKVNNGTSKTDDFLHFLNVKSLLHCINIDFSKYEAARF